MAMCLALGDNVKIINALPQDQLFDVIYADCIYEDKQFGFWLSRAIEHLTKDGVIMVQTDYHTVAEYKLYLDEELIFVNWLIYIAEWGGTSKRFFSRKHDDILVYANSKNYKFYPDRIQIPKVTAGTKLDKKGTGLKTPCDVFYDMVSFSTIAKERVKKDGKNIQWQKPLKLINRLLLPFTDVGDSVLDPFMGSGTTGVWCKDNMRNFYGIENDPEVYKIACERIGK